MITQFPQFPNPNQPPGWQATQNASIAALYAAEDAIVRLGGRLTRLEAREASRAAVLAFLAHFEDRTDPVCRVRQTTSEFLRAARQATDGAA